jgi:hypothetical protein
MTTPDASPVFSLDPEKLWEGVERELRSQRPARAQPRDPQRPARLPPGYSDPANWIPAGVVSLIHEETNTFLGTFQEYFYPALPGSRQLRRVERPTFTERLEYVRGKWWLCPHAQAAAEPARWTRSVECVIGVTLRECDVHCPETLVRVRLEFGGIGRVELLESTRFTCPSRSRHIVLPAGLDLLEVMDYDSKVALRAELEKEEEV